MLQQVKTLASSVAHNPSRASLVTAAGSGAAILTVIKSLFPAG
jgi:hypothetical protein